MKRIIKLISAAAALILCLSALVLAVSADSGVKVSLRVGYSGSNLFSGRPVPAAVTLTNTSEKEISGTVTLSVESLWGGFGGGTSESTTSRSFVLPAGVEKTVEIPLFGQNYGNTAPPVKAVVSDSRGKKLAEATVNCTMNGENVYLAGFVTESRSDASFGKALKGVVTSTKGSDVVFETLTPDVFPSDETMMGAFNMLIIGDVDLSASSSFSEKQIALIRQFAADGGAVILGMGARGAEALRIIEPFLSAPASAEVKKAGTATFDSVSSFYYFGSVKPDFSKEMEVSTLEDPAFTEDDIYYRHGDYNIAVLRFSPADRAVTDSVNNQIYLFSRLEAELSSSSGGGYYYGLDKRFVTDDTVDRSPSALIIFIFMGAYIGLGIILVFGLLLKKKLEKWTWVGIPAAAVLFSLLFIIYGAVRRGGDTASVVTFVNLNETGRNCAETVAGIYAASGGRYRISLGGADCIAVTNGSAPLTGVGADYGTASYGDAAVHELSGVTKDTYVVSVCDYTDTSYSTLKTAITKTAEAGKDKITLRLTNTSGSDLSGVFLYNGFTFVSVGDLASGAGTDIDVSPLLGVNLNYGSDGLDEVLYDACFSKAGLPRENAEDLADNFRGSSGRYYYVYSNDDSYCGLRKNRTADLYRRAKTIEQLPTILQTRFSYTPTSDAGVRLWIIAFDPDSRADVVINGKKLSRTSGETVQIQRVMTEGVSGITADPVEFSSLGNFLTKGVPVSGGSVKSLTDEGGVRCALVPLVTSGDETYLADGIIGSVALTFSGIDEDYPPTVYIVSTKSESYYSDSAPYSSGISEGAKCLFRNVYSGDVFVSRQPDVFSPYYSKYYFKIEEDGLYGDYGLWLSRNQADVYINLSIKDDRLKDQTRVMLLLLVWDDAAVNEANRDIPLPVVESAEFTPRGVQYRQADPQIIWDVVY